MNNRNIIASSIWIYFGHISSNVAVDDNKLLNGPLAKSVSIAIVNHRHEVIHTLHTIVKVKCSNIKLWLYYEEDGHCAVMEKPQHYSPDVEKFLLELWELKFIYDISIFFIKILHF